MNRKILEVYFIMGTVNCLKDPLETLEHALKAGITCFQLREKGDIRLTGIAYEEFAVACQRLCQKYRVPFIINDDVELAIRLKADGIHVGQDDAAISTFRERVKDMIVGISVHTLAEMELAVQNGADYVGIGPVYNTISKPDAKAPAGLHFLRSIREKYPDFPMVGIGGISEENAQKVRQAGADGVSVISVICRSEDIDRTIHHLKSW